LKGWKEGRLDVIFLGEKIKGAFSLIRMGDAGEKSHWLLMKKKDEFATKKDVSFFDRSIKTG
jgi:bifunctional non-homologous end joining protein LigD